jgi:hypothetical protein
MPLVVATPSGLEDDVSDFVGAYRVIKLFTGERGLNAIEKGIDLIDLISPT